MQSVFVASATYLLSFATGWAFALSWDIETTPTPLPPTIAECTTDTECERAAAELCADNMVEWCAK